MLWIVVLPALLRATSKSIRIPLSSLSFPAKSMHTDRELRGIRAEREETTDPRDRAHLPMQILGTTEAESSAIGTSKDGFPASASYSSQNTTSR